MQVNSFFQGMLNIGAPGSQGTSQGASSEEIAKQFEDMLTEHAQQNKQEKPAVKKDGETAEKQPQQPQEDIPQHGPTTLLLTTARPPGKRGPGGVMCYQ